MIILNVLTALAVSQLVSDIFEANFISVKIDALNNKDIKIFANLVRFFSPVKVVQVKSLELKSLPGESANIVL